MQYFQTDDDSQLEELLGQYRDMKWELQPAVDKLKLLEKEIKKYAMDTGEVAEIDGASVSIRKGYTRSRWNGKALTGYGAAHPEIMQFCTEREVGPAAVIKVKVM